MLQDVYETELTGSRTDIAAAIHGVADGVLAGAIRLEGGEDTITVDTPESLSLEIELETDDNEVSLELELEWSAATVDATETGVAVSPAEASTGVAAADGQSDPDGEASDPDGEASDPDGEASDPDGETGIDAAAEPGVDAEAKSEDVTATETDADSRSDAAAVPAVAADTSQSLARFEVFRDRREEWRWRLRHRNGNIIATSGEGYTRKHNAWKGLRSVMANSPEAAVVDESME